LRALQRLEVNLQRCGILGCNVGDSVASLSFCEECYKEIEQIYLEHVQKGGLASIIEAEEEEFGVFVEKTK
jgi:hypothetical protein